MLIGTITLQVSAEDQALHVSSMSVNFLDRDRVLSTAAATLRSPTTPPVELPYRSVGLITLDEASGCYRATPTPGYLVVEVCEREVRIGYGGTANTRLAEAAAILEGLIIP